jgi:hypothetical protein
MVAVEEKELEVEAEKLCVLTEDPAIEAPVYPEAASVYELAE